MRHHSNRSRLCPVLICLLASSHLETVGLKPAWADDSEVAIAEGEIDEDPELARRRNETFLTQVIRRPSIIGLPLAGLLSFVLTAFIIGKGNGRFAMCVVFLSVPIPFLLGLYCAIRDLQDSLSIVASTSHIPVHPYIISGAIATSLSDLSFGLLMMVPGYLVAIVGSIQRSLSDKCSHVPRNGALPSATH